MKKKSPKVRNSDIEIEFSERIGTFTVWFKKEKYASIFQEYGRWRIGIWNIAAAFNQAVMDACEVKRTLLDSKN